MKKIKIKNRLFPGRDALKIEEFYDLARLLIKAGYCVSVNTNDNAGNGKKITTLTFWEQEEE